MLPYRGHSIAGDRAAGAAEHHCFQEKRVTIDLIQKRVSEHFNLREQDLKVRSNTRAIASRASGMYIVKQLTTASLPEIGRQIRRQAPHHGAALDQQDRRVAAVGQRPEPHDHALMDALQ